MTTVNHMLQRATQAQATLGVCPGQLTVIQGCDESEDEAIARAGAQNWTGLIVIIRRFTMTAAECAAAAARP